MCVLPTYTQTRCLLDESFMRSYMTSCDVMPIYERMHTYGDPGLSDKLLGSVSKILRGFKSPTVVLINPIPEANPYLKKAHNVIEHHVGSGRFSIGGIFVVADSLDVARKICDSMNIRQRAIAQCDVRKESNIGISDGSYSIYSDIFIWRCGYVGGEFVNLYGNESIREILSHEIMHSYVNSMCGGDVPAIDILLSPICADVVRAWSPDIETGSFLDRMYGLVRTIHVLSPREMPAYVAQEIVTFKDCNGRADFMSALENSSCVEIIRTANLALEFISSYESLNGNERRMLGEVLDFYLDAIGKLPEGDSDLFARKVKAAEREISNAADKFKTKFYAAAYDAAFCENES